MSVCGCIIDKRGWMRKEDGSATFFSLKGVILIFFLFFKCENSYFFFKKENADGKPFPV